MEKKTNVSSSRAMETADHTGIMGNKAYFSSFKFKFKHKYRITMALSMENQMVKLMKLKRKIMGDLSLIRRILHKVLLFVIALVTHE